MGRIDRRVVKAGMVWYGKKVEMRAPVLYSCILIRDVLVYFVVTRRHVIKACESYRNLRISHSMAFIAGISRRRAPTRRRKDSIFLSSSAFSTEVI